ncbi:zinc-ribbon domain-containing protein, partial [Myxococcota bacterium]|nr:zinc-ribbon domain-containing protein [Myxococcota bacterium]
MIVQCDKCKTKFRIADEKVTDAGVKVRCSRCAHVFMVRRGASGAIELPLGGSSTNPSLDLGLRDPTIDPAAGVPTIPSSLPAFNTRPGGFTPIAPATTGVAYAPSQSTIGSIAPMSQAPASHASLAPSQSYIPNLSIPSLAPEPASQRPGASSFDAMFALGFSAPPSGPHGPEAETQQVALPQKARPRAVSDPFSGWQPDAELARQLGFDDDPTASYSAA